MIFAPQGANAVGGFTLYGQLLRNVYSSRKLGVRKADNAFRPRSQFDPCSRTMIRFACRLIRWLLVDIFRSEELMQSEKLPSLLTLALLGVALNLMFTVCAWAGNDYEKLHLFPVSSPAAGLVFDSAGNLYGATNDGGAHLVGSVYEMKPDSGGGWSESVIYSFKASKDAQNPHQSLVFDPAGNLYGTADNGGLYGFGAIFRLSHASGHWTESLVHSFSRSAGGPTGTPVFDGAGNLYGMTGNGGAHNAGTVFSMTPAADGRWIKKVLYSFKGKHDGSAPSSGLIFDGKGNLYGMTSAGGERNLGAVIQLTPASGGSWTERVLYSFQGGDDGAQPHGGLIFDAAGNLYGTTALGGAAQGGTVFMLTPDSSGSWSETVLYTFTGGADGGLPLDSVAFDLAGNLYGTTVEGGSDAAGTVFSLKPTALGAWRETVLHSFDGPLSKDGINPEAPVIFDKTGNLYGTALGAGDGSVGVVFRITP
jgi:uncharacterized repeat protein (TIGR03803 family)